jgi:hypothetical protein
MIDGHVLVGYETANPTFEEQFDKLKSVVEIILMEAASDS